MSTRSFIRCVFQLRDVEDSLSMKWAFLPHRRYGHPNRYCKGSRESCQAHCDICPFRYDVDGCRYFGYKKDVPQVHSPASEIDF